MSEQSKRDTIRDVQIRAGAIHSIWMYVCHNGSACHAYVFWAELDHSHYCLGKCNVGGFTHIYAGETVSEEDYVAYLLASLPERYNVL